MIALMLSMWMFTIGTANAFGQPVSACGDFLRRYVAHREQSYLILPLVNGDSEAAKNLTLKTAADLRRYLESNPDDPWREDLENLPPGFFREHLILRTEIGPTGWLKGELDHYLELVKSKIAAEPARARDALTAMAAGRKVEHFSDFAHGHMRGRTIDTRDARGVLWLTRALMREALVRHKIVMQNGTSKLLSDVLSDEDVFFFAAFPELAPFWSTRASWPAVAPDLTLRAPVAISLPAVSAGDVGTCELEISRLNWSAGNENVEVRLKLNPACHVDSRVARQWFKARWNDYLNLLAQNPRGETPELDHEFLDVEFDSRSAPRGLAFYMFLNESLR